MFTVPSRICLRIRLPSSSTRRESAATSSGWLNGGMGFLKRHHRAWHTRTPFAATNFPFEVGADAAALLLLPQLKDSLCSALRVSTSCALSAEVASIQLGVRLTWQIRRQFNYTRWHCPIFGTFYNGRRRMYVCERLDPAQCCIIQHFAQQERLLHFYAR